jgi:hypothetical protein
MNKQTKTKQIQKILNVQSEVPGVFYSTELVIVGPVVKTPVYA